LNKKGGSAMTSGLKPLKEDILEAKIKEKLPQEMNVAEQHYHLRPAGVRIVIENTIEAMLKHFPAKPEIFVFADFEKTGLKSITGKTARVHAVKIKELNYNPKKAKNKKDFLAKAKRLKEKILEKIPLEKRDAKNPFIFHAHGLSLGKNPYLTAAVKMLAEQCLEEGRPLWVLNQVHDFAENSRPEMMHRMQNCTGKQDSWFATEIMYPNLPNFFYAVINSRDSGNLLMTGIPKERVFFLPNSVDTRFFSAKPVTGEKRFRKRFAEKLAAYSKKNGFVFDEKRKALLSPLKVMRRKNNAESVLLLMALNHLEDMFQLLVTLDAGSGKDLAYSKKLKSFVKRKKLPVVVGFGKDMIASGGKREFKENKVQKFGLVDAFGFSEAVLTTSIIEGFGFCFHEGWLAGKVVVGRKLHYVCDDFERNGLKLGHMYKRLWVKLGWVKSAKKRLFRAYAKEANALRKKQGIKQLESKAVESAVKKTKFCSLHGVECVDFGELSLEMQLEAIESIFSENENVNAFIALNPAIKKTFGMLRRRPAALISHNRQTIRRKYGLKAKAKRLENIFKTGNSTYLKKKKQGKVSNRKVIAKYMGMDYLHLLTVD